MELYVCARQRGGDLTLQQKSKMSSGLPPWKHIPGDHVGDRAVCRERGTELGAAFLQGCKLWGKWSRPQEEPACFQL